MGARLHVGAEWSWRLGGLGITWLWWRHTTWSVTLYLGPLTFWVEGA
mgnify:CR=1 FL=1